MTMHIDSHRRAKNTSRRKPDRFLEVGQSENFSAFTYRYMQMCTINIYCQKSSLQPYLQMTIHINSHTKSTKGGSKAKSYA